MRLRVLMSLSLAVLAVPADAFGQSAPAQRDAAPPQQTQSPQSQAQQPQQPPPRQQQPVTQAQASDLLRANGNSLLKATIATRTASAPIALADVSFIAVPVPEPKVIRKHDLVTVIVREQSEATSEGNTDTKREAAIDAAITDFVKLKLSNFEIEGGAIGPIPPRIAANINREFKGEGTVDRSDSFITRITAEVLDVKPNGTLVLQARKRIKTDEEEQSFILTGVCRAEDITADNSILSTQLFDLEVMKDTKGTVRNATRKGWGGKLLDAIIPF